MNTDNDSKYKELTEKINDRLHNFVFRPLSEKQNKEIITLRAPRLCGEIILIPKFWS